MLHSSSEAMRSIYLLVQGPGALLHWTGQGWETFMGYADMINSVLGISESSRDCNPAILLLKSYL